MKHSKENIIDLDSDESEQELEFDNLKQGDTLNLVEYLDNQIDTGLQKQVLFKYRLAESKRMLLSREPKSKEEDKYRELDVKRVEKWIERRDRREAR